MKVEFKKYGIPSDELYITEVNSKNKLDANEVLLDILLFPINPADLLLVEGKYANKPELPSSIGEDCVARIKNIGSAVKNFNIGDIVLPLTRDSWIEEKIVKEDELIKLNSDIDLLQASMLKVNPATAYLMLNNYIKVKTNEYIIQNAANSGVGNYIIQLCNNYEIKTINLVRRPELIEKLKSLGADYVYNIQTINEHKKFIQQCNPRLYIDAVAGKNVNSIATFLA